METNAFNIKKGWASNLFCFLTLFAVLNIFFLINVDLLFDLQNSVFLKPCYCTRWFACNGYPGGGVGGMLPYMANTGMCRWTDHCQRTESRHTRHKLAVFKRHLISANRYDPSLHHSNKDTRKVQAFLFRSYNRST